ncbi:MAG: hypothetical protein HW394_1299, partial [Acidobacteria bacterium]|nr:hypothetical protein [Acidobacteriota bacterium]
GVPQVRLKPDTTYDNAYSRCRKVRLKPDTTYDNAAYDNAYSRVTWVAGND